MNLPSSRTPRGTSGNLPSLNENEEATTRNDFSGIINRRGRRDHTSQTTALITVLPPPSPPPDSSSPTKAVTGDEGVTTTISTIPNDTPQSRSKALTVSIPTPGFLRPLVKFASFVGPGFLIAVAYIDPGNYATDAAAGAQSKYALLFVVMMSNLFAVFLQSLCIKLGSVTGLNLAENCRAHLPRWLTIILYILSEAAIIATDIAEVWSLPKLFNLVSHKLTMGIGNRLSNCAQSTTQRSPSSRLHHHNGRRPDPFDLLPSPGINVGTSSL